MNGMLPATAATKQRPVYGIENHFASLHPKDTTQGQQQQIFTYYLHLNNHPNTTKLCIYTYFY